MSDTPKIAQTAPYKFELQEVTGSTFEYQTPVSIQAIPFQFEFHDVLLP